MYIIYRSAYIGIHLRVHTYPAYTNIYSRYIHYVMEVLEGLTKRIYLSTLFLWLRKGHKGIKSSLR